LSTTCVGEVELGLVDQCLIGDELGFVLAHQGGLRVVLLAGDRILGKQLLVSLQVDLRVLQQRPVLLHGALGLLQSDFVRPGIDHRQQVALLDDLTLGELDLHELAEDLRLDRDGRERRHRAERTQHDGDVALADSGEADGDRLARAHARCRAWRRRAAVLGDVPAGARDHGESQPNP
jgi:hypothetical protein